jgi:hypothetical protein
MGEVSVTINVEGTRLTIVGKRESKKERKVKKAVYEDRCSDQLLRVFSLPAKVNAANAEDHYMRLEYRKPHHLSASSPIDELASLEQMHPNIMESIGLEKSTTGVLRWQFVTH